MIHAGASGVGTAAVQLARQAGATVLVTAGSQEKIDFAKSLGAQEGFNYKEGSFKDKVLQATDGKLLFLPDLILIEFSSFSFFPFFIDVLELRNLLCKMKI